MKRDKIDEILSVIDTGLQSTGEASYGETPYDGAQTGAPTCIRCSRDLDPDAGEICSACRAYLLGDTETDPAGTGPHELDAVALQMALANAGTVGSSLEEFAARVEELARTLADALRPITEIVLALPEQTRALVLGEREPTDDEIDRLVVNLNRARIVLETPPGVSVEVGDAIVVDGMNYRVEDVGTDGFTATPIVELDGNALAVEPVWVDHPEADRFSARFDAAQAEMRARIRDLTRDE